MAKAKNAKNVRVIAVYADCWNCGEDLMDDDTGSHMITSDEVDCWNCGAKNKMPKRVTR